MSGEHFEYKERNIGYIAEEIGNVIYANDSTEQDEWGQDIGQHYSPETIAVFRETVRALRLAEAASIRIAYLLSGDDGEETFHARLIEDISKIKKGD